MLEWQGVSVGDEFILQQAELVLMLKEALSPEAQQALGLVSTAEESLVIFPKEEIPILKETLQEVGIIFLI